MQKLLDKLPWVPGRQNGSYKKIKLFESTKYLFDFYLLYYPQGSAIASHKDYVTFGKHYRLNYVLKQAKDGGVFILAGKPLLKLGRLVLFRPDEQCHSVSTIKKGYRIVFSIGWVRK